MHRILRSMKEELKRIARAAAAALPGSSTEVEDLIAMTINEYQKPTQEAIDNFQKGTVDPPAAPFPSEVGREAH